MSDITINYTMELPDRQNQVQYCDKCRTVMNINRNDSMSEDEIEQIRTHFRAKVRKLLDEIQRIREYDEFLLGKKLHHDKERSTRIDGQHSEPKRGRLMFQGRYI